MQKQVTGFVEECEPKVIVRQISEAEFVKRLISRTEPGGPTRTAPMRGPYHNYRNPFLEQISCKVGTKRSGSLTRVSGRTSFRDS